MPQTTYEKTHFPREVVYDTLGTLDFDTTTVTASQANTTVQAQYPLPVSVKVYGVAIVGSSAIAGLTSFNIVLGTGAETGVATADSQETTGIFNTAAAGNQLFSSDQAVTLVAGVPQTFATSVPDAIWPKGGNLTLRIVSTAGGAGNIKVVMLVKEYDTQPEAPGKYPTRANPGLQYVDM